MASVAPGYAAILELLVQADFTEIIILIMASEPILKRGKPKPRPQASPAPVGVHGAPAHQHQFNARPQKGVVRLKGSVPRIQVFNPRGYKNKSVIPEYQ